VWNRSSPSRADWGDNWFLLKLDAPFEYHGRQQDNVLIRSRWENYEVGRDPSTSVFVLLIPNMAVLDKPVHTSQDFEHVSWASATTPAVS
jgi:hypothetical protein